MPKKRKSYKDQDRKQDEKEVLCSAKEGFGTIAKGYRSHDREQEQGLMRNDPPSETEGSLNMQEKHLFCVDVGECSFL